MDAILKRYGNKWFHKAVADTLIPFPPQTDKYSTTAQTAKAIATQSFTAQKKTREESSLPRYTLLAGHPFSIKFVMQLQLQLIIRVKWCLCYFLHLELSVKTLIFSKRTFLMPHQVPFCNSNPNQKALSIRQLKKQKVKQVQLDYWSQKIFYKILHSWSKTNTEVALRWWVKRRRGFQTGWFYSFVFKCSFYSSGTGSSSIEGKEKTV